MSMEQLWKDTGTGKLLLREKPVPSGAVTYPGIFFGGWGWGGYTRNDFGDFTPEFFSVEGLVQQIQLRIEDRENGGLGAVAPPVRGSTQFANE
jgi:hypothetical protein